MLGTFVLARGGLQLRAAGSTLGDHASSEPLRRDPSGGIGGRSGSRFNVFQSWLHSFEGQCLLGSRVLETLVARIRVR